MVCQDRDLCNTVEKQPFTSLKSFAAFQDSSNTCERLLEQHGRKGQKLLQGRTALVTGASSGIGKAIAIAFAEEGAELYLEGRDAGRLAEVQQDVKAFGDAGVHIIEGDLEDMKTVSDIANKVKGKVDILVNNAGMLNKESILEGNIDRWEKVVRLDLLVPMVLTRLIGSEMASRGKGNIINISSVAGLEPFKGFAIYCAAKHGLTGFTLSAFEELRDMGIRVTGIFPGYVATAMTAEKHMWGVYMAGVPPENMILPEDIAEAALLPFRLSDRAVPTEIVVRPQKKSTVGGRFM